MRKRRMGSGAKMYRLPLESSKEVSFTVMPGKVCKCQYISTYEQRVFESPLQATSVSSLKQEARSFPEREDGGVGI